jgi:hypothetical protein
MTRKPIRSLLLSVVAAGLLVPLFGCMTPTQKREDDLLFNARMWNDDFRWGRWEIVGQSMPPEENKLFQERKNLLDDDLVVADYEVTQVRFLQNAEAATVDVKLEWYRKSEPTVRQATLQQRWEYRGGRWWMIRQRRVRGDRFPLVPEPVAPPQAQAPGPE